MPKQPNNGHKLIQNKIPRLGHDDLCAIKAFVQSALQTPNTSPKSNPLPLATLIENDPDNYRHAVDLLARGCSLKAVSISCSLPLATVKAMSAFVPDYHKISRDSTARNLAQASLRMSEILLERADDLAPDRLAFTLAVATEKSELLGGGFTARTETRTIVSSDELQKLFEALPKAHAREISSEVKLIHPTP